MILDKLKKFFDLHGDIASIQEITERINAGVQFRGTNLSVLMLAIFIASIGLNMNSTAVIIGAMLISPLMGSILGIGYGLASYDSTYIRSSAGSLFAQVFISVAASTLYFSLTPIDTPSSELLARTSPTIWDVLIAVFGGLAGIIGVTRKEGGNVIPGVCDCDGSDAAALYRRIRHCDGRDSVRGGGSLSVLYQQFLYLSDGICCSQNH